MNVAITGTGNVAFVLGMLIKNAGHKIVQVSGRNKAQTTFLAKELNSYATSIGETTTEADIYVIAVSDKAIAETASLLKLKDKIVVHTAGGVPAGVLKSASENYGVLYPLQSIRKENTQLPLIPLLVDGCNDNVRNQLLAFAHTISSVVGTANDEQRLALHIAAVFASNFGNYMYTLAKHFCDKEHVSFEYLLPLIKETALRLEHYPPEKMQTGPAARGDINTINKHLEMLEKYPSLQAVYRVMSESIMNSKL